MKTKVLSSIEVHFGCIKLYRETNYLLLKYNSDNILW